MFFVGRAPRTSVFILFRCFLRCIQSSSNLIQCSFSCVTALRTKYLGPLGINIFGAGIHRNRMRTTNRTIGVNFSNQFDRDVLHIIVSFQTNIDEQFRQRYLFLPICVSILVVKQPPNVVSYLTVIRSFGALNVSPHKGQSSGRDNNLTGLVWALILLSTISRVRNPLFI